MKMKSEPILGLNVGGYSFPLTRIMLFLFNVIQINFLNSRVFSIDATLFFFGLVASYAYELIISRGRANTLIPAPFVMLVLFIIYIIFSSVNAINLNQISVDLIYVIVLSFVALQVFANTRDVKWIEWPMIIGVIMSTLGWFFYPPVVAAYEGTRYGGFQGHANTYALVLLLVILFSIRRLWLCIGMNRLMTRVLPAVMLIVSFHQILFATGARKPLMLSLVLILVSIMTSKREISFKSKILVGGAILAVTVSLFVVARESLAIQRLMELVNFAEGSWKIEESIELRDLMLHEAIRLWSEKPLFGWGADQFRYITEFGTFSHMNVVELLANNGLVGLVLYYSIHAVIIIGLIRNIRVGIMNRDMSYWVMTWMMLILMWDLAAVSYTDRIVWEMMAIAMVFSLTPPESIRRNLSA